MDALDYWLEIMRRLNSPTYQIALDAQDYYNSIGKN